MSATEGPAATVDVDSFTKYGYLVIRGLLDDAELSRLEQDADASAPDQRLRKQYNQSDDPFRYEYKLCQGGVGGGAKADGDGSKAVASSGPPSKPGPAIEKVVRTLSAEMARSESFCIVSEPGSQHQPFHTDSIPVEGEMDEEEWQATLHYVGALTPLVNTDPVCGQTGVVAGSHTRPILASEDIFMKPNGDLEHERCISMNRGDVLFLDGRTVHRGRRNRQAADTAGATASAKPGKASAGVAGSAVGGDATPVRRILFFTFKLPAIHDGNTLAYEEGDGGAVPVPKKAKQG